MNKPIEFPCDMCGAEGLPTYREDGTQEKERWRYFSVTCKRCRYQWTHTIERIEEEAR